MQSLSTHWWRDHRRRVALIAGLSLMGTVLTTLAAQAADHAALDYHALDGNVIDTPATNAPHDWDDIFVASSATAEPEPRASSLMPDGLLGTPDFTRDFRVSTSSPPTYVNGDTSYFATGSKDVLGIQDGWQCKKTNNATDKGDYANAYGYAASVPVSDGTTTTDHIMYFFGLEKDDDNGTNNIGVWLLQDGDVGCSTESGGNIDFTTSPNDPDTSYVGGHQDGDLLAVVAYDSGGKIGTAKGYTWSGDDSTGSLSGNPTFTTDESDCELSIDDLSEFCVTTNKEGAIDTPWWSPQKGDTSTTANLQKNVFVEGFIDITNIYGAGNEPCFGSALANTRASTSTTAALYDFVQIESETCGPLVIQKYFDKNADGDRVQGDPPNQTADPGEPFLANWDFKVFAAGADPETDDPIYEVTTSGTNGSVTIPNVPFGSYDIYEVGRAGYYNTDPAGGSYDPSASPPTTTVMKPINKTTGTQTVVFGNACFVDKTFNVNGAPTGANLALTYRINDGSAVTVNMTGSGTTKSYTLNDTLKPTDRIGWSYAYQSGGPSGSVTVVANDPANQNDGESMSDFTDTAGDGSTCAKTNNTDFPYVVLSGTKYKDRDADGTKDVDDPSTGSVNEADQGIGGFDFDLHSGTVDGTQVGTDTSESDGTYSFSGVAPGTYWVTEDPEPGWQKTAPTGATPQANARQVTVTLGGGNQTIGDFLNAPLTDITVTVSPDTTSSYGNISCTKNGNPVGTDTNGTQGTAGDDDTWTLNDQLVGRYVCTIDIIDP